MKNELKPIITRIRKHFKCTDVSFRNNILKIKTKSLFYNGHNIGNYIINIEINDETRAGQEKIVIKHVQANKVKRTHPFIHSYWTCFGSANTLLGKLFKNEEYYQIYLLTLELLTSETTRDHDPDRSWNNFLEGFKHKR